MTKIMLLLACATLVAAAQLFGFDLAGSPGVQTAALGFLGVSPLFRSPDPGAPEGGGKGTIGERLSAAQAEVTTMTGRISSLEGELATARGTGDTSAAELTRLTTALAERETALATAQTELATEKAAKATAEAEVAKLTGEAKTISEQAQEIVAGLGFPASKLPAADDSGDANDVPASTVELETELAKLTTHQEKSALIRRYETAKSSGAK